jgi:hypothetical protein
MKKREKKKAGKSTTITSENYNVVILSKAKDLM